MHYYRYRPFSELSLKELMYSEMYFASPEECNDPFDSKTFYVFGPDKEKWKKTVMLVASQLKSTLLAEMAEYVADHICSQCPLPFSKAMSGNLMDGFAGRRSTDDRFNMQVGASISQLLQVYSPDTRYFVSFSKTNDQALMWSHYASSHSGFCLIFKAIDGSLMVPERYKKEQIVRETPNAFSPRISWGMPDKFSFIDIDYLAEVKPVDAFLHMPAFVSGGKVDEQERLRIVDEQEAHYHQKERSWSYEQESRIILQPPMAWLFGGRVDFSKQERLYHYEPSQLVGIVYGARMTEDNRQRIREILKERRNWRNWGVNYKRIEFSFVEFQAKLSASQRNVEIEPIGLLDWQSTPASDPNFERLFKEWREGVGFERENNSSRRVIVP